MNLAKYLHEHFLGQIFGFARVLHHAQAKIVDTPAVESINQFESPDITSLSKLNDIAKGRVVWIEWLFSDAVHLSLAPMATDFGVLKFAEFCKYRVESTWSLSGCDDGSANFHFHSVLFPTGSFMPGEGLGVVAAVAWIKGIESWVVNLLTYPSLR